MVLLQCRFATGSSLYNSDSLIQEFFSKESNNAVSCSGSGALEGPRLQQEGGWLQGSGKKEAWLQGHAAGATKPCYQKQWAYTAAPACVP